MVDNKELELAKEIYKIFRSEPDLGSFKRSGKILTIYDLVAAKLDEHGVNRFDLIKGDE